MTSNWKRHLLGLGFLLAASFSCVCQTSISSSQTNRYEVRKEHDPNGIGKFYMGREIAHVMGHQAADWLERPEREQEEHPTRMVELLDLKPGDSVADIGAGTGYI